MNFLIDHPVGQAAVLPFLLSLALTLALRLAGRGRGTYLAGAAPGLAFLVVYAVALGVPAFPPVPSTAKIFYIVAIGLALGIAVDLAGATRRAGHVLAFVVPLAALLWIAGRRLGAAGERPILTVVLLFLASILVYWRLAATARGADDRGRRGVALHPAILVLVAALALGAAAFQGSSASLAQLGFALAAACGGHILAEYAAYVAGGRVSPFGATGALSTGGALLVLAYVLALFVAEIGPLPLALILGAILAEAAARPLALRLTGESTAGGRALRPILFGLVALVPAALAILLLVLRP